MGKVDKTTIFNVIAIIVAIAGPVLVGQGFTGEVSAEWAFVVPFAISLTNIVLKRLSGTEFGRTYNL